MTGQSGRTDVTDEVVGAVGFPPNDAQRLGQHEAVLQTQGTRVRRAIYLLSMDADLRSVLLGGSSP